MSDIFNAEGTRRPRVRCHFLKSWPASVSGDKPFDVRKADRDYRVGDWVKLHWYDNALDTYRGEACYRRIGHIGGPCRIMILHAKGYEEGLDGDDVVILGYVPGYPDGEIESVQPR